MSADSPKRPSALLRDRVEHLIHHCKGKGLSLDYLCQQLPDLEREQIRNALKASVKRGQIMRHGSIRYPLYQSLLPNSSMGHGQDVLTAASVPPEMSRHQPAAQTRIGWPEGVQVQCGPSPSGAPGHWTGTDWSHATQRPGCLDHLRHPSRRGDQRVPYQAAPLGCVGELRDKRSNGR